LFSDKVIFISALDWGLGHATRCVPLIRKFQKNNKIIIGVTPLTKSVFEEEFPSLEKINLPAYNVRYSKTLPLWLKLFFDWPRIKKVIKDENTELEKIISKYKIDVVISDNRFGLYSKKIHSVFITHQLFIKTPFATGIIQKINKKYILNFDEIWIPDFENETESLSGELSHGEHFHKNVKYIGPLSRLQKINSLETKYDYLFLISGPEPQHSILRNLLCELALQYPDLKFCLISNVKLQEQSFKNIETFVSPNNQQLSQLISQSKKIICRSGYSTLMDIFLIGIKNIILVPTPGQTEQEYLANNWKQKFNAKVIEQKNLSGLNL